ncbi:MAG: hypothetical protein Ct9H300mP3_02870 [Gammaproteobacteria bacterium]|nr:MAG: hypothetical protein Ct9H300mP3_02870 [Gammaproteobacteria bacterium]
MKIKLVLLGIFFLSSCTTFKINYPACVFPDHSPFPGGVINKIIKISSTEISNVKAEQKSVYLCQVDEDHWKVLVPISLSSEIKPIIISNQGKTLLKVPILDKEYRESKITINNTDLVSPPAEYLPRIKKESELGKAALSVVSDSYHSALKMSLPLEGLKSSEFGVRRFIK